MNSALKIRGIRNSALSIVDHAFTLVPWLAFLLSIIVYWLTVDPGASYWDCPEYLIIALKLEIGHPPGNPGWALVHRVVSSFFTAPASQVLAVNMMSGMFMALSAMILCSVSITLMRWVWTHDRDAVWRKAAISMSSLAGSLCFAWSDSAWYSAVEAEVYAMSLFLSALTVWMALKWAFARSSGARVRWTVALFYAIGFSLGVHQLNLLALPAIALIILFRKYKNRPAGFLSSAIALIAGCLVVVLILKVLMPGAVYLAGFADLFAVNSLRLPYWSGAIAIWVVAISMVVVFALLTMMRSRCISTSLWSLAAVMLGYSVYILIPIRAWANPPVNEGNPSDPFRLADYLDRRQYAGAPLLYGRTPYSRTMRIERMSVNEEGDTLWDYSWNAMRCLSRDMRPMVRDGRISQRSRFFTDKDKELNSRLTSDSSAYGYVVAGFRTEPRYTPELDMWFSRIHASSSGDLDAYRDWAGMDTTSMLRVRISEAFDSVGNPVPLRDSDGRVIEKYSYRPTYLQSLAYLFGYQVGYMYLRYLMWNYSGRQNDVASTGEIDHGNFITGIRQLDDLMLGPQSQLPPELGKENKGHNVYLMLPFILGLIGIIWLFKGSRIPLCSFRMRRVAWVSLTLFLMTGAAIVIYLNQAPGEPRERDYSFLGSLWTFAFWIAFGMLSLVRIARKTWVRGIAVVAVCVLPVWMLNENNDDHDRSNRSATLDYASNLLESLDKDAILFVDGDNYIFPLWFAQEVMGVRRDVTVICCAYLSCDWYVRQLMTPRYDQDGLALTATEGDVSLGNFNLIRFPSSSGDTVPAIDALKALYDDRSSLPAFSARYLRMGNERENGWTFDLLSIPGKGARSVAGLRELAVVDIVATNAASRYPRPVYWHQALGQNKYSGFFPFTRQALFTRRLMPELPDSVILLEESLDALPSLKWGGIDLSPYPGVDVNLQAEGQRASLIRLAQSLSESGRHDQALHVAKSAIVRYPDKVIPYGIHFHMDTAYFEARELAKLLQVSGEAMGDKEAVALSREIEKADSIRVESFRRYRQSLPPWRRSALSPSSRNHSIR